MCRRHTIRISSININIFLLSYININKGINKRKGTGNLKNER